MNIWLAVQSRRSDWFVWTVLAPQTTQVRVYTSTLLLTCAGCALPNIRLYRFLSCHFWIWDCVSSKMPALQCYNWTKGPGLFLFQFLQLGQGPHVEGVLKWGEGIREQASPPPPPPPPPAKQAFRVNNGCSMCSGIGASARAVKTQRTHRIAVIDAKRLLRRLACTKVAISRHRYLRQVNKRIVTQSSNDQVNLLCFALSYFFRTAFLRHTRPVQIQVALGRNHGENWSVRAACCLQRAHQSLAFYLENPPCGENFPLGHVNLVPEH